MKIVEIQKTILLVALICLASTINAQSYNDQVSDILVQDFLYSYLNDYSKTKSYRSDKKIIIDITPMHFENPDSLLKNIHNWNKLLDCLSFNLDSLLNDSDKSFIVAQIKSQKDFTWGITHPKFSFGKIKEPSWTDFYYRLSMPIFSKSRDVAIIMKIRKCGFDCGDLMISVYKKKKNKWILMAGWGYVT